MTGGPVLYDKELERALLGALIVLAEVPDDRLCQEALAVARPRDFFTTEHREVFSIILALNKKRLHYGLDTVAAELERKAKKNGSLTRFDLTQMTREARPPFLPVEQARQLRALGERRDAHNAVRRMANAVEAMEDPTLLRGKLREEVISLEREGLQEMTQGESAPELMARHIERPVPVVQHLFFRGTTTLIGGRAKAGKSILVLQAAIAVAAGVPAYEGPDSKGQKHGFATGAPRDVVYACLDDPDWLVRLRLGDMLVGMEIEAPPRLRLEYTWPRFDRGGLGLMESWAEQHPEGLMIFDLLEHIRPQRGGHAYSDDMAALHPLSRVAHATGCTVVVTTHTRKVRQGGEPDPAEMFSGTQGLFGAVDHGLIVHARREAEAPLKVTSEGRLAAQGEHLFQYDEYLNGFRYVGEEASRIGRRPNPQRQEVVTILQAGGPMTIPQVAERVGKNYMATAQMLGRMLRAGQITQLPDRRYAATQEVGRSIFT